VPGDVLLQHGDFCRLLDNDSIFGCGTQVEKQGKACRKELERALTRAAMDQDLGAIDEAEVVLSQKEHKLERLLTQKNMIEAAWYVHDWQE